MRIALHFKLMATYLLVVALAMGPVLLYLRAQMTSELRGSIERGLRVEVLRLRSRFASIPPAELQRTASNMVPWVEPRITVIDANGVVLADSEQGRTFENHRQRPEVAQAISRGFGEEIRESATTRQRMLYVAARIPEEGPLLGVVRLARPLEHIQSTASRGEAVTNQAAAVALSVAVLLSAMVALVLARPLTRLSDAAKSLAAGDFGYAIEPGANDEIGDAARALQELSSQVRERLVLLGADRATLGTLLDELPVGVVLFTADGELDLANGPARFLLGITADTEEDRLSRLRTLAPHDLLARRAVETGASDEAPLELPWKPNAALMARWFGAFGPKGTRRPGVLLRERSTQQALERLEQALAALAVRGKEVLGLLPEGEQAWPFSLAIEAAEDALTAAPVPEDELRSVELSALCALAGAEPLRRAQQQEVQLEFEHEDGSVAVTEGLGRARRAIERGILAAIRAARKGTSVVVRSEIEERSVLVVIPTTVAVACEPLTELLRPLGGEAVLQGAGDRRELQLRLAKA